MAAFNVLETQFQMFITSQVYLNDEYVTMKRNYFIQYTQQAILEFRDTLVRHLESVKKLIDERAQLKREYDSWMNERQMHTTKEKVDTSKALDASSVDTESSRRESKEQDTSSRSGNDAYDDGADIRPIYNEEPMAKVALCLKTVVFCLKTVAFCLKTVARMIATPGEPDLPVPVPESFHEQTDEELTETDIKRMDADDQAIQTFLLGLPEDIYAAVDSCETAKEIWKCVRQMMKILGNMRRRQSSLMNGKSSRLLTGNQSNLTIIISFRQTKNLHETDFTQIYDFLKMNQEENFMKPPMTSLEDINDPTEATNAALILFAKAFQLSAPTNNNQRTSSNTRNCQIAQPVMNMGQDRQIHNVGGNGRNQFGQYAGQVAQNQQGFNAWQNGRIQGSQNAGVLSG
nr:hypothetical protein [Tanacetum cinerariifolium]